MNEWKPIPLTGGNYEASPGGEIRRATGGRGTAAGRVKIARALPNGYMVVSLSVENKPITRLVHRLVADAFHGPCPDGNQVNHKDGNRRNNAETNLEYVTQSENNFHAVGRIGAYRGNNRKDVAMTADLARSIRMAHRGGTGYKNLAKQFDVTLATARNIATGKTWAWATNQPE